MTRIDLSESRLRIEILGWHKLWSFKSRFDLPLAHVIGASPLEEGAKPCGLRLPGTYWPGVICAGSFFQAGEWTFWDVCQRQNAVVIALANERYAALIVETVEPEETLGTLRRLRSPGR